MRWRMPRSSLHSQWGLSTAWWSRPGSCLGKTARPLRGGPKGENGLLRDFQIKNWYWGTPSIAQVLYGLFKSDILRLGSQRASSPNPCPLQLTSLWDLLDWPMRLVTPCRILLFSILYYFLYSLVCCIIVELIMVNRHYVFYILWRWVEAEVFLKIFISM